MKDGSSLNHQDELIDDLAKSFSSKRLHLILLPTEQCNFRCTYCYEDFTLGKMKEGYINGIESLISKRVNELDELELGWFGGEPLLSSRTVLRLSNFVKEIIARRNLKCVFKSSISTNASLLNINMLESLVDAGVSTFQITLDGHEKSHNKTRIYSNGKGSYSTIWNNLLSAKNSDINFKVSLRLHLHNANFIEMDNLCNDLISTFGGDSRFNVYFKCLEKLSDNNEFDSRDYFHGKIKTSVMDYFLKKIENTSLAYPESKFKNLSCYASHANSLVIRSNGDIAKCTVDFANPLNKIGHLNEDGTLLIDNEILRLWLHGYATMNADEIKCPLSYIKKLKYSNKSIIKMFGI